MMSSENDSLIDLANMAKWLMNESQQPSVTQELGRLFLSIRGRGRRGESSELLLRVGAGESSASATDTNNTSFATRPTRKRTIEEIWGSKASSKKPPKSMSHKTTSGKTPSKFAALSCYSFLCLRPATLLKKRLWHSCFPVNFVKFLRTPLLTEHLWKLLLLIHVISQV